MKSIKALAALAIIGAAVIPAKADSLMFNNPANEPYFGARVAIDISSAANGGAFYSNKPGFSIGGIYNIPLYANLYFEPGLSLFYDVFGTMYFDSEEIPVTDPETGVVTDQEIVYQVDGSIRNLGFRVPLNFGYHFDFADDLRVKVFTGPQFNASILARYHQNAYITPSSTKVDAASESVFGTGGFKHFDMQWNFGVGVDYGNYSISLGGSVGMTRLRDAAGVFQKNMRRNIFSIALGYNF